MTTARRSTYNNRGVNRFVNSDTQLSSPGVRLNPVVGANLQVRVDVENYGRIRVFRDAGVAPFKYTPEVGDEFLISWIRGPAVSASARGHVFELDTTQLPMLLGTSTRAFTDEQLPLLLRYEETDSSNGWVLRRLDGTLAHRSAELRSRLATSFYPVKTDLAFDGAVTAGYANSDEKHVFAVLRPDGTDFHLVHGFDGRAPFAQSEHNPAADGPVTGLVDGTGGLSNVWVATRSMASVSTAQLLLRSADSGNTWSFQNLPVSGTGALPPVVAGGRVWVAVPDTGDVCYAETTDLTIWTVGFNLAGEVITGLAAAPDGSRIVVCTASAKILTATTLGVTQTPAEHLDTSGSFSDIHWSERGVIVVGSTGIWISNGAGDPWSAYTLVNSNVFSAVVDTPACTLFAARLGAGSATDPFRWQVRYSTNFGFNIDTSARAVVYEGTGTTAANNHLFKFLHKPGTNKVFFSRPKAFRPVGEATGFIHAPYLRGFGAAAI